MTGRCNQARKHLTGRPVALIDRFLVPNKRLDRLSSSSFLSCLPSCLAWAKQGSDRGSRARDLPFSLSLSLLQQSPIMRGSRAGWQRRTGPFRKRAGAIFGTLYSKIAENRWREWRSYLRVKLTTMSSFNNFWSTVTNTYFWENTEISAGEREGEIGF